MAVLLVCIVAFNLPQTLWGIYRVRTSKALRNIPGWPTHWLWGNLHQLKNDEATMLKWRAYIQDNRHKLTRVWVGPLYPILDVCHCDAVEKVIKLPKCRFIYAYLIPWLGDGLLVSENKKWFRNRRLLTPAFHYEILKGYTPVVNSCLEVFVDKWTAAAKDGVSVCTFKDVSKLSLDIIMRCAFSTKSNCQLSEDQHYINTVNELVCLVNERFYSFLYTSDFIYSLSSPGRKFARACKVVHDHTESVIRERKQALGIDGGSKEERESVLKRASSQRKYIDFLDILLTAQDEDGRGMTDLEIRDEADTFMFEGHDTTTSGMSWTFYCLAQHPEHQDKIREEVRNVLMGREWLEYDDLKELKYTTWCIKEAMRLYPPVLESVRVTTEDLELEGHVIPKGVITSINIIQIHRHPDIWDHPNEYNPLRFHPSNAEGRHPYAYIPFSASSRNCIGQNFALNEEKMVVASIINRFHLTLDDTHKVEMSPQVILRAKNDIKLKLLPVE